jgi:hypothetical protein
MNELVERIKELELRFPLVYEKIVEYLLINANRFRNYDLVRKKYRRHYNSFGYAPRIPEKPPYDPDTDYKRVIEFIKNEEDNFALNLDRIATNYLEFSTIDIVYNNTDTDSSYALGFRRSKEDFTTSGLLDKILWAHHWIKIQNLDDILAERTTIVFKTRNLAPPPLLEFLPLLIKSPIIYPWQLYLGSKNEDKSYACLLPSKFKDTILTFRSIYIFEGGVPISKDFYNFSGTLRDLLYTQIKPLLAHNGYYHFKSRVMIYKDMLCNSLFFICDKKQV